MKNKSIDRIPKGIYCYTWEEHPSSENEFKGKIKNCPYYEHRDLNGVSVPWCAFLGAGGTSNDWSEEDWASVRRHYKSEEAMDEELPLFLLWDSCKECGENTEE